MDNRTQHLMNVMQTRYGLSPTHLVSAPGRVELGGNHTDHNDGKVLAASVGLDMVALVTPLKRAEIVIYSDEQGEARVKLDTLDPVPAERGSSPSLVRGIARFLKDDGYDVGGVLIVIDSRVLPGSGLSSSAAFEVLIGGAISAIYNDGSISPVVLATIGHQAENHYFGKPSGLMDQLASAVGGVISIDFAASDPLIQPVSFDLAAHGYEHVIVNSKSSHANLTPAYAAITDEMRQIAKACGATRLRAVDPRDFYASIKRLRALGNDRAVLRAIHYFAENDRVSAMLHALETNDLRRYFALVTESGHASGLLLQNTRIEGQPTAQPISIALALSEQFLQGDGATRIQGGGFAGTIQTYVSQDRLDEYIVFMESVFGADSCAVVRFRPRGITTTAIV